MGISMWAAFREPCREFTFRVHLVFLAVGGPSLFQRSGLLLRGNFESGKRQNQGADSDIPACQSARNLRIISGNQVLCGSPDAISVSPHFSHAYEVWPFIL
jgi:hypothetical protein